MTTYVSEETGERITIECRFCRKFTGGHRPAVALAGQWEHGDPDDEPHWVPVCQDHSDRWHIDADTGEPMPEEHRLPTIPLPSQPSEGGGSDT